MAMNPSLAKKRGAVEEVNFIWQGKDKRGVRVKGELRGFNQQMIRAELRRQGITPLKVRKKPKPLFTSDGSINPKDIMLFTRQLYTMLNSGIPIVQAIDMVAQGAKKPKLQKMLSTIKKDVESGTNLATALEKYPVHFNDLYTSLIRAGEEAGVLENILDKLAIHLEKLESLKAKVKKALVYPAIVLTIAFGVTAFIMVFVIPTFEDLFKNFGADLPAFTQLVVNISHFFQEFWWLIFGGIGGGLFGTVYFHKRSRKFQHLVDRWVLKLPLFGKIAHLSATTRFARTLSTMFDGGVPLVDSLTSVAGATGNIIYEKAVIDIRDAVSTGQQLNFAMRQTSLFNPMVLQMVAIGEDAGSLGSMLAKVADYYEEELDNLISALTTLIEPIVIVILGVLIGSMIVAMYLPIFKLALTV